MAEQRRGVERPAGRYADLRQQCRDEIGLARAELVSLPASVQAAERGGVAVGQAPPSCTAAFNRSTRSSLSQLNPPSPSGVRPKWP